MLSGEMLEGVEKLYGAAGDDWKYAKMADGSWKVMDTTKPDFGWITPNAAQVKAIEAQLTEEGDERGFKLTEEPLHPAARLASSDHLRIQVSYLSLFQADYPIFWLLELWH